MSHKRADARLSSWKAIARHIRKSERTARRWEAEEGMPVHRHMHQSLASVYAYETELDEWLARHDSKDSGQIVPSLPPPVHEEASIAVLPFDFVGSEARDAYLADGFTDEVISDLAKVGSLRVISRTSSKQLKGSALAVSEVAEKLNVQYILEGSVRRHRDAIKVSAQLIDPTRDRQVWSEKLSGRMRDVLTIQEQIARAVTAAMRLRLTDADESRLANRGISDVSAWIAAVQARQASLRWTRESIAQAIAILEEALRSSGDIPELYVLLGKTYLYRREAGFDLSEHPLSQARRCVDRAIAADQDGAGAHELQGWLHYSQGQIQQAVVNYKMALSRQGSNPDTLGMLCQCYLLAGQLPVARALIPNVLAMDPLSSVYQLLPAWADVLDGKHASAIASYRALLEREPGSPLFRLFYIWILAINGKADEIETVVGEFPAFDRESLPARISRGFDAACRGIAPETEFSTKDRELTTINDMYPRMLAQVYALSNKPDEAIEWLSMAVARGFVNYPYLNENDPILTRLRNFPRYRALLRDVKQRWIDFVA